MKRRRVIFFHHYFLIRSACTHASPVVMALQLFISEYLKEMQEACILLLSRAHAIHNNADEHWIFSGSVREFIFEKYP
jgi:hypothetical protein